MSYLYLFKVYSSCIYSISMQQILSVTLNVFGGYLGAFFYAHIVRFLWNTMSGLIGKSTGNVRGRCIRGGYLPIPFRK